MSKRAGWGLGNVYQRRGRWYLRYSINGKQVREATKILVGDDPAKSEIRARQALKAQQDAIAKGNFVPRQNRVTLDEVLDAFLVNYKLRGKRALKSTETVLRHVRAYFRGYRAIEAGMMADSRVRRLAGTYGAEEIDVNAAENPVCWWWGRHWGEITQQSTRLRLSSRHRHSNSYAPSWWTQAFCPTCGSPVYTTNSGMPDLFIVEAASLDDPARFAPQMVKHLS